MLTPKLLAVACRKKVVNIPLKKVRGKDIFTLRSENDVFSFFFNRISDKEVQISFKGDRNAFFSNRYEEKTIILSLKEEEMTEFFQEGLYEFIFTHARHMFLFTGIDMPGKIYCDSGGYLHAGTIYGPVLFRYHEDDGEPWKELSNVYGSIFGIRDVEKLRSTLPVCKITIGDILCEACGTKNKERKKFLYENEEYIRTFMDEKYPRVWMNVSTPVQHCSPGDIFDIVYGLNNERVRVMVVGNEYDYMSGYVHCCLINDRSEKIFLQKDERLLPDRGCVEFWNYCDIPLAALHPCASLSRPSYEAAKNMKSHIHEPSWMDMPILPRESLVLDFRRTESAFFKKLARQAEACQTRQAPE